MEKKLSAASIRAQKYSKDPTWYCEFMTSPITGELGRREPGVVRRDPTAVIQVGDIYHVWYSRSTGRSYGFGSGDPKNKTYPWDYCDIWHATSRDGWHWEEKGLAIERGAEGSYDDRSVFTPEILAHEGKFYMVYQVLQSPYLRRSFESIALAVADSPEGPWVKSDAPILEPVKDGIWEGEEDNRFRVEKKGSFDSLRVHDPTLMYFKNKFYLYYKGEPMGEQMTAGGRETKWGIAIADKVEGPYIRSEYNPVTNSGHEVCVWHYNGGMAAMLTSDGHERNTIQWAEDGVNFEIMSYINGAPEANGLFRCPEKENNSPLAGLGWGLCHEVNSQDGFMKRFEVDEYNKNCYINKQNYIFRK